MKKNLPSFFLPLSIFHPSLRYGCKCLPANHPQPPIHFTLRSSIIYHLTLRFRGGASALALAGGGLTSLIITPPASSLARPRPPHKCGG